jgi:uncharacterized protein (DUF2235 family)
MKRLIVCCDGTWQKLTSQYPTNVVKMAQAITSTGADGVPQIVFYDAGLGTGDWRDNLKGGAFGIGLDQNIQDGYRFLCLNYEDGDEIYLFGFSRGAYTVRSLGGLIARFGLLPRKYIRETPKAYEYYRLRDTDPEYEEKHKKANEFCADYCKQVEITLMGCWDTVGSLGIPDQTPLLPFDKFVNEKYRFHDTKLSSIIQYALHAAALDETRSVFDITPMQRSEEDTKPLKQVWFPGDHGCVGGGAKATAGLSDRALEWMKEEIEKFGLKLTIDFDNIPDNEKVSPDHRVYYETTFKFPYNIVYSLTGSVQRQVSEKFEDLDTSVIARWRDGINSPRGGLPYRPASLKFHSAKLNSLLGPDAIA